MKEPSVLDYVKSRLMPWKYQRIEIPPQTEQGQRSGAPKSTFTLKDAHPSTSASPQHLANSLVAHTDQEISPPARADQESLIKAAFPWRSLLALFLACAAQFSWRPMPERNWLPGVVLMIFALAFFLYARSRAEWQAAPILPASIACKTVRINSAPLLVGALLSLLSFASFSVLKFTYLNLSLLCLTVFLIAAAFWTPLPKTTTWIHKVLNWLKNPYLTFSLTPKKLAILSALAMVVFFRFYHLGQIPPEMNSDHAEKIFDILRVLDGQTSLFFPNNGGREPLQMFGVAALHRFFGMQLDFLALKLVTALVGFLALPFLYLLGKEMGSQRIGMLAFLLAGIAYWQNVVSRVGLRLPFFILFSASTLYFLLRGIRTLNINHFIFAGISLGLSLYGYSADRILPLLVITAVALYLLHPQSHKRRSFILGATLALVLVSLVIFIPLLRYILAEPDSFLFRTLTRLGDLERPLDAPAWVVFLNNTWRALTMLSWDAGEVWVISIPHTPALGVVAGGLFYIGLALLLLRYLKKRYWLDLFLIISIPILMLPSIMSLAFPAENPNLYRTGGASIPVFLIVAIALDGLMRTFLDRFRQPWNKRFAWLLAGMLIALSAVQNYERLFQQYYQQYLLSAWNSSEMGDVAAHYAHTIGSPDTIYVMGFPHWVDTRLVAITAGYPGLDYQLFPQDIQGTLADKGAKLFLLNPQDFESIETLEEYFPNGWFQEYQASVESKNFLIFFAPPLDMQDR